jgi:hypothetical protein
MKRIINILVLFIISAGVLTTWDYPEEELAKDFSNKAEWKDDDYGKQYFFDGFNFTGYDPKKDKYGLSFKIQSEAYNMEKTWQEEKHNNSWNNGNFYFLGHSQGGLRALATASWLKDNKPELYDKLNCVITVSGIDRGLKALDGGVDSLTAKLRRDYQVLYYGALSAQHALDDIMPAIILNCILKQESRDIYRPILEFYFGMCLVPSDPGVLLNFFNMLNIMPELAYIALAFNGVKMSEIDDMVPGSKFITDTVVNTNGDTKKVVIVAGYHQVVRYDVKKIWGFLPMIYSYTVKEPIYKLVDVYDGKEKLRIDGNKNENEDQDKNKDKMPLGFIVGLKSDSFSINEDEEKDSRDAIKYIGIALEAARIIHTVRMSLIYGYFAGSPAYYDDAVRAKKYIDNIDDQLNELKGSPQNDGLVALESQYYPKSIHGNVLGGYEDISYVGFDLNHKEIIKDDEVKKRIEQMADDAIKKRVRP